jgi:signal transduction histidine kinase/ActR/RegA family two-component response regulator
MNRGIALIGFLGIIVTTTELIILTFSIKGLNRPGMEFHRIEALAISFYLFALPYLFHSLLELNYFLRRINRYIYIIGFIIAVFFSAAAFISPEMFLSFNEPVKTGPYAWNTGRAAPGILFRIRDVLLMFISFYSLTLLFYEMKISANRRFLKTMMTGIIIGILSGVADLIMNLVELDAGMHAFRVISYINVGLTAFTIIAVIAVIRIFIDESQALERLRKNEFMELLAGGIAHDFNNLLTGILGNTSLALYNASENGGNTELLRSIEKAAKRGRGLSRQLLDFSKGGALMRGVVSLEKIITENVKFIMTGSGIDTLFHFDKSLLHVNADESQISQVIQNIAINAKQAMDDAGTLTVVCRNTSIADPFSMLKPGRYIKIEFRDTGPGIPEKNLKNIFDPYYTTKKTGTGLGLATAFSIIKNHGGLIEVSSKQGNGSTFTIYLPASEKEFIEHNNETPLKTKHRGRALIMDDDNMILGVGMKILTELGFNAECVTCGEDALEEYQKAMNSSEPYRLVIMDLTIAGGMGGKDAVKLLKKFDPSAKVILSTGYSHDIAGKDFSDIGFDGILPKPYTFEEMKQAVEEVLK